MEGATETDVGIENISLQLSDHSTYARNKLAHLQERLTNKLLVSVNNFHGRKNFARLKLPNWVL